MGDPIIRDASVPRDVRFPSTPPETTRDPDVGRSVAVDTGRTVALEFGDEITASVLRAAPAIGRVLTRAVPFLNAAAFVYDACQIAKEVMNMLPEATRQGLLLAALGTGLPRNEEATLHGLGVAAVLGGATRPELEAMARELGPSFAAGVEMAQAERAHDPDGFAAACEEYQRIQREWCDGLVAGLQGWDDAARGGVFERAREHASSAVRAREPWAVEARARSHAAKDDGFLDAASGRVDRRRVATDASYRSGVTAADRMRDTDGGKAVDHRAAEIRAQRDLRTQARVAIQG